MVCRLPFKASPKSTILSLSSSRQDDRGSVPSVAKIVSMQRVKELFATRYQSEFPQGILEFVASRLRSRLPSKLREADTAIAIEAAQLFAAEWCKFVCIDGPNLDFKYKRMDDSLYVTLSFQNEELLIANLHDGCLAWAL